MFDSSSEYSGRGIGDLDMYVHLARLVARSEKITFPRLACQVYQGHEAGNGGRGGLQLSRRGVEVSPGPGPADGRGFERGNDAVRFEEPGLEKDFFWEVVRPLGPLRVS